MRHWISILPISFALLLNSHAATALADEIRVGGTGGAAALLTHLGKPFTRQTGIALDVVPDLGSGGGISAAADLA